MSEAFYGQLWLAFQEFTAEQGQLQALSEATLDQLEPAAGEISSPATAAHSDVVASAAEVAPVAVFAADATEALAAAEDLQTDEGACAPVPTLEEMLALVAKPTPPTRGLREDLEGSKFAWCHDGRGKTGWFSFEPEGLTGGEFKKWSLVRWQVKGENQVTVDNGQNMNVHNLVFNCKRTGFFVEGKGQRGFKEGKGFASPDDADAPSDATLPYCGPPIPWSSDSLVPVWVWWDFKDRVPSLFRMNLRTWQHRIPRDKFTLQLVNESNIKRFLPSVPESFFHLYQAAKADFIKASLLAAHGGVYLDGDVLLSHNLDVVVADLLVGRVDVLPYEGPGDKCPRRFTSNVMAGVKGNRLSTDWTKIVLRRMAKRCQLPETNKSEEPEKVCCYNKDCSMRNECHVAWGELSRPPKLQPKTKLGCVPFRQGFVATHTGDELFMEFGEFSETAQGRCWPKGATDLECRKHGEEGIVRLSGFFDRHGHHLLNMVHGGRLDKMKDETVLRAGTVVSELYRRALELP